MAKNKILDGAAPAAVPEIPTPIADRLGEVVAEVTAPRVPRVGDRVTYVLWGAPGTGQHRFADVVTVIDAGKGLVSLNVGVRFGDYAGHSGGIVWIGNGPAGNGGVPFDPEGKRPGTWHFRD